MRAIYDPVLCTADIRYPHPEEAAAMDDDDIDSGATGMDTSEDAKEEKRNGVPDKKAGGDETESESSSEDDEEEAEKDTKAERKSKTNTGGEQENSNYGRGRGQHRRHRLCL